MNARESAPVNVRATGPGVGPLLNDFQARREALAGERLLLRQRIAALRDSRRAAGDEAAAQRDVAASVRAETRVVWDEVHATRQATRRAVCHAGKRPTPPVRVLVVDDLAAMRRMLVRQLTRAGHTVVGEAATVAEAVARARALALGGLAPDVVLLDFHLPDGLGTDVAARLPAAAAGCRPPAVVFCTGDVEAARAALAGPAGAACGRPSSDGPACAGPYVAVLEKPAPADVLDHAVRDAAARAARAGGAGVA